MKTDVCLVLEGTYPFVHGGVSSWIHKLVTSLSEIRFSIIHLSSAGDTIKSPKYDIPPNILEFKEIFVHDFKDETGKKGPHEKEAWKALMTFYEGIANNDLSGFPAIYEHIIDPKTRSLNTHDLMFSKKAWDIMAHLYDKYVLSASFVDFYWTIRFIHSPLFNLFRIEMPDAAMFHTICTGYAGILAVLAKIRTGKPLILTEHGIYTHERKIEISRARWIYSEEEGSMRATRLLVFLKMLG